MRYCTESSASFLVGYFGLALAETVAQNTNPATTAGSWGGDASRAPSAAAPWFFRGGASNDAAIVGVFAFGRVAGQAGPNIGWRAGLICDTTNGKATALADFVRRPDAGDIEGERVGVGGTEGSR